MFRFEKNGIKVECDTSDELNSVVGDGPAPARAAKAPRAARVPNARKNAMTRQWDAARKLAKDENITVPEARAKLAKQRKAAKAKA